jgi:branched-chain amino acid transport system ATP-binding protein
MLHVESIEKSFDGFMAVNGATLKVERGDVVAVIGPNGAGKTTLFNLITGQLPPTAGRILVQGREYRRPGASILSAAKGSAGPTRWSISSTA